MGPVLQRATHVSCHSLKDGIYRTRQLGLGVDNVLTKASVTAFLAHSF